VKASPVLITCMYLADRTYENSSYLMNAARSSRTSLSGLIAVAHLDRAQNLISRPSAQLLVLLCDSCSEQSCTAASFLSLSHLFPIRITRKLFYRIKNNFLTQLFTFYLYNKPTRCTVYRRFIELSLLYMFRAHL
jgi:hypothetical protein